MADSMCQTDLWLVGLAVLTLEHFDMGMKKNVENVWKCQLIVFVLLPNDVKDVPDSYPLA